MSKVSYDNTGSYRKQSSSSYRSDRSSYTNREMQIDPRQYSDSPYRSSSKYKDFDEVVIKDDQYRTSSRRDSRTSRDRRESESRENRGYRSSEREKYPSSRNQTFTDEHVHLIQPNRGRTSRTPSSLGGDSVRTDVSKIPMGLEVLQNVDTFVIRQKAGSEAWWDAAKFQVEDGRGEQIFEIQQEQDESKCIQAVFGKMREYFLKVYVGKHYIMELEHPWSFLSPIFCPWSSPTLIARMPTGEVLGQVRNASRETCGTCLPPTKYFEVVNFDGSVIHAVTGPTCYPFECSSSNPASFELLKVESHSERAQSIGRITHTWRGACGGISSCCVTDDSESVTVNFPNGCTIEEKALFLALGFLVLFTFFDYM